MPKVLDYGAASLEGIRADRQGFVHWSQDVPERENLHATRSRRCHARVSPLYWRLQWSRPAAVRFDVLQQDGSREWISADGHWRGDGLAWVPTAPAPSVPAPLSFGDVISLPTRDPRWFAKCGIEGLIALIPIYGAFELLGWSLSYLDNLRAGRLELPEARFGYASRGARVAAVFLIFALTAIVLFWFMFGALAFLLIRLAPPNTPTASDNSGGPFPAFFVTGIFASQGLFLLLYALLHFLVVPIIIRTERHGLAGGLNLVAAARMATADLRTAAAAAILVFLAGFFASLGIYACLVGVVLSYGYGAAMLGATVRWYDERRPAGQD